MGYPTKSNAPVPKKVESLYQGRIRQFNDKNGQYRSLNLPQFFDRTRIDNPSFVRLNVYSVADLQRPSFHDAMKQAENNWKPTKKGDWFGPSWSTHWFKVEIKIPGDWKEKYDELPIFDFDSSDEGFLYTEKGEPVQGLSGEHQRTEVEIKKEWAQDGKWHTFYIETSCNDISGTGSPPDPNRQFRLNRADLLVPNAITRALNIDFWLIGDAGREFPDNSWQKHKAIDVLNRIINTFDRTNVDESCLKCREIAAEYIGSNVDSEKVYNDGGQHELVWAIGNCHIDTAWLWPYAETRRKIARSWSSQLALLDKYPEYVFTASQAVQFQWLKEDHPDLFKRVKEAAKKGRFIPIGGSWVECDTNMPNGESLVRQMWLGQRFFEREFGIRSEVFWLPDTFGYAPQLPQICRLAGQPYFLTQKLSWNNINVFPLSTFSWVGLDGSQVICHMPPANTYTAQGDFGDVKRSIEQHKNLETSQDSLLLFGHGDGGGGPTAEMIEKLRRCRAISNEVELLPTVASGPEFTPTKFYESILEKSGNGESLVTWKGELYLEYHRGTYTTQASIKRGNRRSEELMKDVEYFSTYATLVSSKFKYPFAEIERLWELVCLNQFHDVLPGSGIEMIYEDARKIYADIWKRGTDLLEDAHKALGLEQSKIDYEKALKHIDSYPSKMHDRIIRNAYDKAIRLDFDLLEYIDVTKDNPEHFEIENNWWLIKFTNGQITSIFDKQNQREVLAGEKAVGNNFYLFEDQPLNFPAWDTEQYATEKFVELKPRAWQRHDDNSAEVAYEFGAGSKLHQRIVLHQHYIDFVTNVDWRETYQFLKVEFPVDVMSDYASYETSFGFQRRPTHTNTSWDAAKFEVNGHKFADLSDWQYGVALLNDSKYGYSVQGNQMRLSLLRSPKSPDAHADMGLHSFSYALAPHHSPLRPAIVKLAALYNENTYSRLEALKEPEFEPLLIYRDLPSVIASAVKRADADAGSDKFRIVLRLYEFMGGKAKGYVGFSNSEVEIKSAKVVNILEDEKNGQTLEVFKKKEHSFVNDHVEVNFSPFEVKTIIFELL